MNSNTQRTTVVDLLAATDELNLSPWLKVVSSFKGLRSKGNDNLLLILNVSQIEEIGAYLSQHESIERSLRAVMLQDADKHLELLPQLLASLHKRVFKVVVPSSEPEVMKRILFAWGIGAQDRLIANAQVLGDRLVALSCSLERLDVPFDALPALRVIPVKERSYFRINEQGSYIHWASADIHLDLDSLRYAVDPKAADKIKVRSFKYDKEYGQSMASIRKEMGLKQSDIAGLTDRHVRRIEAGEMRPTAKALRYFAKAHGMGLDEYLSAIARCCQVGAASR